MEVLIIRLIGADEHLYTSYVDSMQWLEDTNVLEMIVDKFSSTISLNYLSMNSTPLMVTMHEDDTPDLSEVAKILEETLDVGFFLIS
ncbi:putative SIT4 phosphatase-associated protein family [Helianthus annuus]|nr:putative SIT4 phosphatase-associated protein family [Helianthus annuus]